ncbi:putative DNA-directed RNA polymerase II largest subunit [Neospora caninum Liverpool]|uniref:DNA-directed RNA polymerase II largest subunit,putative n=1 Tax=Neospora caninum (strain Liverpool) TaxID=572307 RepID=F0VQI2_NEOCL|nr:putative DNA-directed RNA polymerase II largest subunit [Neospora caninum Liverpool]CBZ55979.1 putative DNA-directed RNA polymerase II largest subunit [Neospora caninum Liverpool]CEL70725.1 TPA: DNA-directed RNA polymerase II largest subunit,putative [Neospora caninum Liverpool]|eukprot:XP_003886005.1 putative DNA-directed RNA polymerase II largest subunit [Neospora caninum Liverpool]
MSLTREQNDDSILRLVSEPVDNVQGNGDKNPFSPVTLAEQDEEASGPSAEASAEKAKATSVPQNGAIGDAEELEKHINIIESGGGPIRQEGGSGVSHKGNPKSETSPAAEFVAGDGDPTDGSVLDSTEEQLSSSTDLAGAAARQDEVVDTDDKETSAPALNALSEDGAGGETAHKNEAPSTPDSSALVGGSSAVTEGDYERQQQEKTKENVPSETHQKGAPSNKANEGSATTRLPEADSPAAKNVQASPQHFLWGAPDVLPLGKYLSQVSGDFIDSPAMAAFSTFATMSPVYSPFEGIGMSPSVMRDDSGTYLPPVAPAPSPYMASLHPAVFQGGMSIDPTSGFSTTNFGAMYSPNFSAAATRPIHMPSAIETTPSVSMMDNTPVGGVSFSPALRASTLDGSIGGLGMPFTGVMVGQFNEESVPLLNGSGNSGLSSPSMTHGAPRMQFGGSAGIGMPFHNRFFPTADGHNLANGGQTTGNVNTGFSITPGEGTPSPKHFPSTFPQFSFGSGGEFPDSRSGGDSVMKGDTYQEINNSFQASGTWNAWSSPRARDPFND